MTESSGSDRPPPETPVWGAEAQNPVAPPAPATPQQPELPKIALIQAGLTVFDGVLLVVFVGLWFLAEDTLFQILQRAAGFCLLLALIPIVLGGVILQKNKKAETPMPGTVFASLGMWIGVVLSMMTLLIPTIVTFRALFDSPGAP
jgi:hypothetical protein